MAGKSKENGPQEKPGFLARLKRGVASPSQPKAGALSPSQQQQQRVSRVPAPLTARGAKPTTPRGGGSSGAPPAASAARANVSLRPPGRGADSPTPRNFAKPLQSARGPPLQLQPAAPPPSARGRTPDGSLTARRVPKEAGPTPSSSYRDALVTPRYAGGGGSRLPAPPPSARLAPPAARRDATPEASPRQQSRVIMQQMARASSETEQARQQISRLESGVGPKQAELAAALDQLAALSQRREALAEHVASLRQLAEQAKKAEAQRTAELQDLDFMARSLRAGLDSHRLQEAAAADKAGAARAALLGMMQTAATILKLPALAASLQQELAAPGSSGAALPAPPAAPPAGAAARAALQQQAQQACPLSPSDAGSQGFITPAASIQGDEGADSEDDEAYVSDGGGSSSSGGGSARGEVTARPEAAPGGAAQPQPQPPQQQQRAVPALRLSPLAAGEPGKAADSADMAAAGPSPRGQVTDAARVRLQAIRGRLEAALAEQAVDLDAPLAAR